jgi:hypothetical protein
VGRFFAVVALSSLVVACSSSSTGAIPSPSPSPHTTVSAAVLQQNEVPTALAACPGSGPIAGYLSNLQTADPALASQISEQWQQLRAKLALDAAISLYAADPTACTSEMAVSAKTKAAASFVVVFADAGQAERAWAAGILGFVPPASDQITAGLLRGPSTGLGDSSWTYTRPPVQIASWRRSEFVSLLVLTNLDAATFKSVTSAIDARLN